MNPSVSGPPLPVDALRSFWQEADLPAERWPYYEFQARRYGAIAEFLRPYGPWNGRRVLDLGGGVGGLSVLLHGTLGGSYDLAEFALPSATHRAALERRGVERAFAVDLSAPPALGALPSGYDAILLVEVLEHLLVNPLVLFREIWDHLRDGGLLFLTTPNMARLTNRLRLLRGRSIKESGRYPYDGSRVYGHVIEFTQDELDHLLTAGSFRPDRSDVVQQVPQVRPSGRQRLGVSILNLAVARRLRWGDDLLASYRKIPRPPDGRPPVPLDAAGRI